jgi:type I restriction enzyme, S subunit
MNKSWQIFAFEEAISDESGGNIKTPQSEFLPSGKLPIVDQGKALISGYINDSTRMCKAQLPVITFGDHTRCFKFINFPFGMGADGIKILHPRLNSVEKYLFHYLRSLQLPNAGYDRHFKYLKRTKIPLPPIAEQKRIAAILDKAEEIRSQRRQALEQLDAIAQSIFLEMFGDQATNPKGWEKGCLGDIAKFVGGGTPKRECPEYFEGSICWATSKDMKSEFLDGTQEHITPQAIEESATNLVPIGTMLIVVKSKILAHSLPVSVTRVPTCFGQDIKGIKISESCAVAFVATALQYGRRWLLERARGINTEGLTLDHLRAFPLMLPPIALQQEFARRVEAIAQIKTTHRESLAQLDTLFASL